MPFDGAMEARRLPTSSQPNRVIDLHGVTLRSSCSEQTGAAARM